MGAGAHREARRLSRARGQLFEQDLGAVETGRFLGAPTQHHEHAAEPVAVVGGGLDEPFVAQRRERVPGALRIEPRPERDLGEPEVGGPFLEGPQHGEHIVRLCGHGSPLVDRSR